MLAATRVAVSRPPGFVSRSRSGSFLARWAPGRDLDIVVQSTGASTFDLTPRLVAAKWMVSAAAA